MASGPLSLNNSNVPAVNNGNKTLNNIANAAKTLPAASAATAHDFVNHNPGATADVTAAVAKTPGINPKSPALTAVNTQVVDNSTVTNDVNAPTSGFADRFSRDARRITHDTLAIANFPYQLVQANVRNANASITGKGAILDIPSKLRQTDLGQALSMYFSKDYAKNPDLDVLGDGWFPSGPAVQAARTEAMKKWTINGEPATFGNIAANGVGLDPNSNAYKFASVGVDLLAQMHLDPTIIATKGNAAAKVMAGAKETAATTKVAAKVTEDTQRIALIQKVAETKNELQTLGKTVRGETAKQISESAQSAKELATAPSEVIHAVDPNIVNMKQTIAQIQSVRTDAQALVDTIKTHADEFAKTPEAASQLNPYAQRLTDAQTNLKHYDDAVAALNDQIKVAEKDRRAISKVSAKALEDHAASLNYAQGYIPASSVQYTEAELKTLKDYTTRSSLYTKQFNLGASNSEVLNKILSKSTMEQGTYYRALTPQDMKELEKFEPGSVWSTDVQKSVTKDQEFVKSIAKNESRVADYSTGKVARIEIDRPVKGIGDINSISPMVKNEGEGLLARTDLVLKDIRKGAVDGMDEYVFGIKGKKLPKADQKAVAALGEKQSAILNDLTAALEHLSGITKTPQGLSTEYDKLAEVISGRYGEPLVQHIINSENPIQIWRDFKKTIPMDTAVALSKAEDRQTVLNILAPLMGGKIEGSLPMTAAAKIAGDVNGLPYGIIPNWVRNTVTKGSDKINALVGFVPKGQLVHLDDTNGLVKAIDEYGTYMKLPKTEIDRLITKVLDAKNNSERGKAASIDLFNSIFNNGLAKKNLLGGLTDFQKQALTEATRVFDGGKTGMSTFWASRHAAGAHMDFVLSNGEKVTLTGPHLESELLNSTVYLPSPTEIKDVLSSLGKTKTLAQARVNARGALDLWRTSKLLRPAYMVRNLMEMQIRQYLEGSESFITNPAASLAMILGKEDGPAWRKLLAKTEQFSGDALGNKWKNVVNPADDEAAWGAIEEYNKFLGSQVGSADVRVQRNAALQGFAPVEFGHKKFFTGHAFELKKLSNDSVAKVLAGRIPPEVRDAVGNGKPFQDAVVDYFHTGPGKSVIDKLAASRKTAQQLFTTREGIQAYIFDVENGVQARLDEMTGGIPSLLDLVANGSAKMKNGVMARFSTDPEVQRELVGQLKKNFSNATELTGARVNVRLKDAIDNSNAAFNSNLGQNLRNATDSWFAFNNKMEKVVSMAPEFRVNYWEQVAKYSHSLDAKSLERVKASIDESLLGIRVNGKTIGKNSPIYKTIMAAKGDGPLGADYVNVIAAEKASAHVKGLFYDAYNNRNIFHALRFAIPFGQAWADTIIRWGKLAKENPGQVYKAEAVLNKLVNDPKTSAIYGMTGVTGYDPNQGFIQKDPTTGQSSIYIPYLGSALSALASATSGVKTDGAPFQIKTNPIGLNFALGGSSIAPGVGPGITIPVAAVMPTSWWNGVPPIIQNIIFPYGKPQDLSTAFASTALPAWASKMLPLFSNGSSSQLATLSTLKPTMDYLATTGNYDLFNQDDQARLIKDSSKFATWFGFWTGITQSITPTSPMPMAVAKMKDGTVTAQAAIYAHFQDNLNGAYKGDYYGAVRDVFDKFGVSNVFALISATKGGTSATNEALNFLKKNSEVAGKYDDVFTLFFPGGGFSQALYQQQVKSGQRVKLSSDQILQQANYMLYMARKDQIDIQAVNEGWDAATKSEEVNKLNDIFGGSVPSRVKVGPAARYANPDQYMINRVTAALKEPAFANTEAGQATRDYIYLRNKTMEDVKAMGYKTLKGAAVAEQRQQLRDYATAIDKHYGGNFALMFQSVFQNEVRD